MTWNDLYDKLCNLEYDNAYLIVCGFMVTYEDVHGSFPDWDDLVPQ